jgi:hypothetical protein
MQLEPQAHGAHGIEHAQLVDVATRDKPFPLLSSFDQ